MIVGIRELQRENIEEGKKYLEQSALTSIVKLLFYDVYFLNLFT